MLKAEEDRIKETDEGILFKISDSARAKESFPIITVVSWGRSVVDDMHKYPLVLIERPKRTNNPLS